MLRTSAPADVAGDCTEDVTDHALILFGSQTGVALAAARRLHDQMRNASVRCSIGCLNQFQSYMARQPTVVVFVSSTFMDGGAPENALRFAEFLDRDDQLSFRNIFASISFAVLGVGHSMWPKFCHFARHIDDALAGCGARRLVSRLDVDSADTEDQREESIHGWTQTLINRVLPTMNTQSDIEDTMPPCSVSVEQCCHLRCSLVVDYKVADDVAFSNAGRAVHLDAARRIYGDGVHQSLVMHSAYICRAQQRRVLHLELEVPPSCVYGPGDCVAIPCANPSSTVQAVLSVLDLQAETLVDVPFVSEKCALSWALKFCFDICSTPSGSVLAALGRLSASKHAGQIASLATSTRNGFNNIVDLFAKCGALRPTADELVRLLDPLALRYYSIASSPYRHPNHIHMTVAIAGDDGLRNSVPCTSTQGLCTGYLEQCHLQRQSRDFGPVSIPLFIRSNRQLRLPCFDRLASYSIVMIGCGVGIAPFRAFLQHIPEGTVKAYLFFGFRDNQDEYLYKHEWRSSPAIEFIEVAFSRLPSSKFRYVQDALRARSDDLVRLIITGAVFYVCGSLSMAADVYECFLSDILCTTGGLSRSEAVTAMEKKVVQGLYMVEAWD